MKVEAPGTLRSGTVRRNGQARPAASGGFADRLIADPQQPAAAITGSAPIVSVEALLAVQGTGNAPDRGRDATVARAEDLLEKLDKVRLGLLAGRLPRATLEQIVQRLDERRHAVGDPRLLGLIDEIELRAKVELAKLSIL